MSLELIEVCGVRLFIDFEATKAAFGTMELGWGCTCGPCLNLRAVIGRVLGKEVIEILTKLGADPQKPTYSCHFHRDRPNAHLYEVAYHLFGEIDHTQPDLKPYLSKSVATKSIELQPSLTLSFLDDYTPSPDIFRA